MGSKEGLKVTGRTPLQGEFSPRINPLYCIKVGRKVIWEGKNLHEVWPEIRKELPTEKLTIAWKTPPEFLIV